MMAHGITDQVRGIWACTNAADRASLLFSCFAAIAAGALNPIIDSTSTELSAMVWHNILSTI